MRQFPLLVLAASQLFLSRPAGAAAAGKVRLALIEDEPPLIVWTLAEPMDRLLRQSSAAVVESVTLPAEEAKEAWRCRLPAAWPAPASTATAAVFDAESEVVVVSPPLPSFLEALRSAAADPASYQIPWSVRLSSRVASYSETREGEGRGFLTTVLKGAHAPGPWRGTVAVLHRLRWDGNDVTVAVYGKVFGGLGRLASALERERKLGPLLGVSRAGVFGKPSSDLVGKALAEALEKMGLRYAAVTSSELRSWTEFEAYRDEHPDGIKFLSANLVYSSAPAVSVFDDAAVVEAGGLKIAITAVTRPSAAKYLARAGLEGVTIVDPLEAVEARIAKLAAQADLIVLLADVHGETLETLRRSAQGVDVILAEAASYDDVTPPPAGQAEQRDRNEYELPLWTMRSSWAALDLLELGLDLSKGTRDQTAREWHVGLDASVPEAPGLPGFDPAAYGIEESTAPPLLPSARKIFPPGSDKEASDIGPREFWTMAASLLSEETGSELGVTRVWPLSIDIAGDIPESAVKRLLRGDDPVVMVELKGAEVKSILADVEAQGAREEKGLPYSGKVRLAAGGLGAGGTVHGLGIDDDASYKVATTQVVADALGFSEGHALKASGKTVGDVVLAALRARAGSPPSSFRSWMEGRPVAKHGFWRINYREVGLNVANTDVIRDDAFNEVSNPRIQGSNQLVIGGAFKADADFLDGPWKWSNTLEMEYARTRIEPRDAPPVINTTSNRITFQTSATRRAGSFPLGFLARSWGPSLGFQYDGQLEQPENLPRRDTFSAYPGFDFYDGSFIRSLKISANITRDTTREPLENQHGIHAQVLMSKSLGFGTLEGEGYYNYLFRTLLDSPTDLLYEGNFTLRLSIPVYQYLTLAPFVDYYFFGLKTQPLSGYSAVTGISISFSRLWKPQYEDFWSTVP